MLDMNPQYPQQPMPQMPPPGKKSTPVWLWILGGALVFVFVVGIAVVAGGIFLIKSAQDNPTAALAKLVELSNPNIEVLSVDDATGKVTIKDKETGKTVTVSMDDLKQGKLEVKTDEGTVQMGANVEGRTPDFVPIYPGAKQTNVMSSKMTDSEGGTVVLEVKEEFGKVKSWYEEKINNGGFETKSTTSVAGSEGPGAMMVAAKNDDKETLHVMLNTEPEFTRVTITYALKK
jgi:hypothetical protein